MSLLNLLQRQHLHVTVDSPTHEACGQALLKTPKMAECCAWLHWCFLRVHVAHVLGRPLSLLHACRPAT